MRHPQFLNEIIANPDDDAPRLVYADWLEDQGDPRCEFIRVQCQLAQLPLDAPQRPDLEGRELALVRQYSKGWADDIRPHAKAWWFRRGFVESIKLPTETYLAQAAALHQAAPLNEVHFMHAYLRLAELGRCEQLSQLRGLGLSNIGLGNEGNPLARYPGGWTNDYYERYQAHQASLQGRQGRGASLLTNFLSSPQLENLRALYLAGNRLGDAGLRALAGSSVLETVETLDVGTNDLSAEGIQALAASPHTKALRRLLLPTCHNVEPENQTGPLPRELARVLPQLEQLDLSRCALSLFSLRELGRASKQSQITRLALAGNRLTEEFDFGLDEEAASWNMFLKSPLATPIIDLDLSSCYIEPEPLGRILNAPALGQLRRLRLDNNDFESAGCQIFVQASVAQQLTHLSIAGGGKGHQIKDSGAALLCMARLPALAALELPNNQLSVNTARMFLNAAWLSQLYLLDLRNNAFDDQAAEFFLHFGPWPKLASLNLRGNKLSSTAKLRLRQAFGYRVLV